MPNTLVALGAMSNPVEEAEARFDALPWIDEFDRSMSIDDVPPHVAAGLAAQFDVPFISEIVRHFLGVADLPQTDLDRNLELRWEGAKRIGRRVAQQYLGPGEETVTLKGTIYPPRFGRFEDLESLRASALAGQPLAFVTGYGRYHGIWSIKAVKDTQTHYFPNGYPRKVEFTIELVHYGNDNMTFPMEVGSSSNSASRARGLDPALDLQPPGIDLIGRIPDPFET